MSTIQLYGAFYLSDSDSLGVSNERVHLRHQKLFLTEKEAKEFLGGDEVSSGWMKCCCKYEVEIIDILSAMNGYGYGFTGTTTCVSVEVYR